MRNGRRCTYLLDKGLVAAMYAVEDAYGDGEGLGDGVMFGVDVFFPANYAHRHIRSSIETSGFLYYLIVQ